MLSISMVGSEQRARFKICEVYRKRQLIETYMLPEANHETTIVIRRLQIDHAPPVLGSTKKRFKPQCIKHTPQGFCFRQYTKYNKFLCSNSRKIFLEYRRVQDVHLRNFVLFCIS